MNQIVVAKLALPKIYSSKVYFAKKAEQALNRMVQGKLDHYKFDSCSRWIVLQDESFRINPFGSVRLCVCIHTNHPAEI